MTGNEIQAFEAMKNIDACAIDPDTLVDIQDVSVNQELPREERQRDYIRQIKNPYCFRHGKTVVKISHADTETTLEDQLERYLLSL